MTDDIFTTPGSIGDSPYFRPKDHKGEIVAFVGGKRAEGLNYFGDPYTVCDLIVVLRGAPEVFSGFHAELSNIGLMRLAEGGEVVIGRLVTKQSKKSGKDYWTLEDLTDEELAPVRSWWTKHMEKVNGSWHLKSGDPNEAPF